MCVVVLYLFLKITRNISFVREENSGLVCKPKFLGGLGLCSLPKWIQVFTLTHIDSFRQELASLDELDLFRKRTLIDWSAQFGGPRSIRSPPQFRQVHKLLENDRILIGNLEKWMTL